MSGQNPDSRPQPSPRPRPEQAGSAPEASAPDTAPDTTAAKPPVADTPAAGADAPASGGDASAVGGDVSAVGGGASAVGGGAPAERKPRVGLRSLLFGRSDDEPADAPAEEEAPADGDRFRGLRSVPEPAPSETLGLRDSDGQPGYLKDPPDFEFRGFDIPRDPVE